ncbi:MAG: riboflavin biosynthesis protein RibF [Alphaproteobacteria bacterium]|nr:riboflavin biosynthesis protein RibF [Alphaproteobacteria bacterium]
MKDLVLAIGNFDGVHCGHQKIISAAKNLAAEMGLENNWGVMFFDPHPRIALKNHCGFLLTSTAEKLELLKNLGVPCFYVIPFKEIQNLNAHEFFHEILQKKYNVRGLITGDDFNFGKNRLGDANLIAELSKHTGIKYICLEKQMYNADIAYSSTNIRKLIGEGNIQLANNLLGHNYKITAPVMHGNKLGRTLGFPTANLSIAEYAAPKYGVYVVYAFVDGVRYKAIANFGLRPSVSNKKKELLEVNLFDFEGDLYEASISVEFIDFIRIEQKFASLEDLKNQLNQDKIFAINYFEKL